MTTAFVSFFVSDTAATTLMLPIVLAILSTLKEIKEKEDDSQKRTESSSKGTAEDAAEDTEKDSSFLGKMKDMLTSVSTSEKSEKKLAGGLDIKGMSKKDRSFCKAMVLSTAQASLIGGTGIITGTGTNLVFREQVPRLTCVSVHSPTGHVQCLPVDRGRLC